MRFVTPYAWRVPTALFVVYTWMQRRRPATKNYCASAIVQNPPEWLRVVCDWFTTCQGGGATANGAERRRPLALALRTTAVVYVDGAYSAARGGGSQQAGFGISIVRGGDGIEDRDAKEEVCACGCVILDPSSPVFIGALEHTSSTGELSALTEALWWLLEEDKNPKSSVLLRPDSEYAMAAATGDITPDKNVEMVRGLQRLYARLVVQRKGKVKWAHVRSHTDHMWNDRVDDLAEVGTTLRPWNSRVPGERWRRVRLDGLLTPHRPLIAIRGQIAYTFRKTDGVMTVEFAIEAQGSTLVRIPAGEVPDLVMHLRPLQVDEPARVLRARGAWGVLNLIPGTMQNAEILAAKDKRIGLIHALSNDVCSVSDEGRRRAEALVRGRCKFP